MVRTFSLDMVSISNASLQGIYSAWMVIIFASDTRRISFEYSKPVTGNIGVRSPSCTEKEDFTRKVKT